MWLLSPRTTMGSDILSPLFSRHRLGYVLGWLKCRKRLMAMTDRTGRTKLVCLKCDNIDPMKTDAVKWAYSGLASRSRG